MKIDWKKAEREFVTTNVSLEQLAKKYGVSKRQMGEHSSKDEWMRKREEFLNASSTKLLQKAAETVAKREQRMNETIDKALDLLLTGSLEDAENASTSADRRIALGNIKIILDTMQQKGSYPHKIKEAQARIQKLNAETKSIEDGVAVDHDVKIEFVNGDWMNDDTDTESNTKAD